MSEWESFYVIVGSSGGALIGLQFVVITLIADRRALATRDSLSAFGTPTVVHLTVALIVSAIMSAPWRSFLSVSLVLMACGIGGLTYGIVVILRARRQTSYTPVLQDWIWYVLLPCSVYAVLTIAGVFFRGDPQDSEFVIASTALALLLIGIHNAWDTVTHIVVTSEQNRQPPQPE